MNYYCLEHSIEYKLYCEDCYFYAWKVADSFARLMLSIIGHKDMSSVYLRTSRKFKILRRSVFYLFLGSMLLVKLLYRFLKLLIYALIIISVFNSTR